MNYYEEYVQIHRREPTYVELKEMVERAQNESNELDEQALDQAKEILAAIGINTEEPKSQPVKTCSHLRENGEYCGSIAVKGQDFCAYHLRHRGRRLQMARARARHRRLPLQLPPLEDLCAVQVSIDLVLNALLNGQIELQLGRVVLRGLQQASTNLCRPDGYWSESPFKTRQQLELPGFEKEFGLPQGTDLNAAPDEAFAQAAAPEISEERANLMEVTPVDIDLMETSQREGPDAVWRKVKQLDAAEQRRYKRAQQELAHARHVVRAAAQNAARETYFVERSEAALAAVEAKEKAAAAKPAASLETTGAPPLSASFSDSVAVEAGEGRKEPQSVSTDAAPASAADADSVLLVAAEEKKLG